MATKLSQAARKLLEQAGCSEIADDFVILGSTDLRILLSRRAVEDLNDQAREVAAVGAGAQGKKSTTELKLTDCQKRLTLADLALVEQDLRIKLPEAFRSFYLQHNGGTPDRTTWVDPAGKFDDIEVRDFLSMLYFNSKGDDPDFTLNGIARSQWAAGDLPKSLLPFAIDWGGNYLCLDIADGKVCYFLRDVWSDNLSTEKNREINTRPVAESFSQFVSGLIPGEPD